MSPTSHHQNSAGEVRGISKYRSILHIQPPCRRVVMASPKRPKTYRVTGIPLTLTTETLKAALSEHLPSKGEDYIQIKVDIVPSCDSKFTNTALVSFTPHPPTYLEPLSNGITDIFTLYTVVAGYGALVIDMNMYGLTQLYATPPGEKIVAE